MTIVITGWRSRIAEEFRMLIPNAEGRIWGKPMEPRFPTDADRYLFCQGLLRPKSINDQTDDEIREGVEVNFGSIVRACDLIIAKNDKARVCVVGSESGFHGSFDENYASSKAMIHRYIETKELRTPSQQLIGISPTIVEDCRMTTSRLDKEALALRRANHPKKRFLEAKEVAELAFALLYRLSPYLTGAVIRLHGGIK